MWKLKVTDIRKPMKTTSFTLGLAVFLAAASGALAADKAKATKEKAADRAKKQAQAQPGQEQAKVMLTGSYLKQTVRRNGRITDGFSQVIVLDRDTIER